MSFIRFIYNIFFRKFLDKSFTLNDFYTLMGFVNDIKSGKVVDTYEATEIRWSEELAQHINTQDQLVPSVLSLINDKKKGPEIRKTLLEHRLLIHAMFYLKTHLLTQMSKIIDELENTVKIEEERNKGCMRIVSGHEVNKR